MKHALGLTAPRDGRASSTTWNQRRAGLLPDRDHGQVLALQRSRHREAAGGHDPRHGRPEGDRASGRARTPSSSARRSRRSTRPSGRAASRRSRRSACAASEILSGPTRHGAVGGPQARSSTQDLRRALYAAKVSSLRAGDGAAPASLGESATTSLDLSEIARIWKGGCIIRAAAAGPRSSGAYRRTRTCRTCCSTPEFARAHERAHQALARRSSTAARDPASPSRR